MIHDPAPAGPPTSPESIDPSGTVPAGEVFAALWSTLSDVLGTGAAAVLVRRAAGWAARSAPSLSELQIGRTGLGYSYTLPTSWADPAWPAGVAPVRSLLEELGPLLVEMTGPVVVRRLAEEPALRAAGVATEADVARWLGGG